MREVRMTFGEHLEELRRRLIIALVWLAASTSICFVFYEELVGFSMKPHEHAVTAAMRKRHFAAIEKSAARLEGLMAAAGRWEGLFTDEIREYHARTRFAPIFAALLAEVAPAVPDQRRQAVTESIQRFGEQLSAAIVDLVSPRVTPVESRGYRERFESLVGDLSEIRETYRPTKFQELLGLGVDFDRVFGPIERFSRFLGERQRAILETPPDFAELERVAANDAILPQVSEVYGELRTSIEEIRKEESPALKVLKYTEAFMASFKVALIFGILFALPLILYEMWKFIGAGLHENEQRYILVFFPFSIGLFLAGAFFGYNWMVPFGLQFLAGWGTSFADVSFTLDSYIGLFFTLTIILGLVFQTPLVMLFFFKIDLVSSEGFTRARKYFILGAVIFSTLVTPPDPLSWSLMSLPIIALYQIGIWICRRLERRRKRREAVA